MTKKRKEYRPRRGMHFLPAEDQISDGQRTSYEGSIVRGELCSVSGSVEVFVDRPSGLIGYPVDQTTRLPVISTSSLDLAKSVRFEREDQSILEDRFLLGLVKDTEIGLGTTGVRVPPPTITLTTLGVNHAFVGQALSSSRHEQQVLNCMISSSDVFEQNLEGPFMNVKYEGTFATNDELGNITYIRIPPGHYSTGSFESLISKQLAPYWTFRITTGSASFETTAPANSLSMYWTNNVNVFPEKSGSGGANIRDLIGFDAGAIWQDIGSIATGTQGVNLTSLTSSVLIDRLYSKRSSLKTVTYKWSAAAAHALKTGYDSQFGWLIAQEDLGGTDIPITPQTVDIAVAESGRLVNVRAWVEIAHMSASAMTLYPLENLIIALRSPNLRWGQAHPIRNDELFKSWQFYSLSIPIGIFRDSFILWEGSSIMLGSMSPTGSAYDSIHRARYPTWGKDRSMRVIFDDASPIPNPRHLLGVPVDNNVNGSPNLGATGIGKVQGNDVPWISDPIVAGSGSSYGVAGSPPQGWLTGPGGTAGTNEWPTTGSNYGAEMMRPLYPMLDPVYERKVEARLPSGSFEVTASHGAPVFGNIGWDDWAKWNGYRPGLRGTEINGTWQFLLAVGHYDDPQALGMNTYVRQLRLELTYMTGDSPRLDHGRSKTASDRRNASRPGSHFRMQISGSGIYFADSEIAGPTFGNSDHATYAPQNYYKNEVTVVSPEEDAVGRMFGIITSTSSLANSDYALFYRLSGALAERVGESPTWLVGSFGVPMIPDSSASLVSFVPADTTSEVRTQSPFKNTVVDFSDLNAKDFINRTNPPKKLHQIAAEFGAQRQSATKASISGGSFVYVCRGDEGTDFRIKLEQRLASSNYEVLAGTPPSGLSIDFPKSDPGDRTSFDFRVLTSAPVSAGDRITFQIVDLTKEI